VATKRLKRPRDPIQLGKLIVDIATGQVEEAKETKTEKRARSAGKKGGPARSASGSRLPLHHGADLPNQVID
jgi:hypothetical protein